MAEELKPDGIITTDKDMTPEQLKAIGAVAHQMREKMRALERAIIAATPTRSLPYAATVRGVLSNTTAIYPQRNRMHATFQGVGA